MPTPTPSEPPAGMTPFGRRFHVPGQPYASACAVGVLFVIVTLQPTGLTELIVNERGENAGLPVESNESVETGGAEIPTRVCITGALIADGLNVASPRYWA